LTQPPPQLAEDHQYYETLGLPYEASSEEVRRAYRKAAIKYHPDKQKGGAEEAEAAAEQFRRVALAHRVLSDPQRRARYNEIITLCWEVAAEGS
jgi:molecular chaperone DnaJ